MKKMAWIFPFAMVIALACGPLGAVVPRPDEDVVTLKDGRVLQGRILEEQTDAVVALAAGRKRTYSRDFMAKISLGRRRQ